MSSKTPYVMDCCDKGQNKSINDIINHLRKTNKEYQIKSNYFL